MMDNKDELTFELQKALAEKEIMDKVNVRVRRKTSLGLLFISFMSLGLSLIMFSSHLPIPAV